MWKHLVITARRLSWSFAMSVLIVVAVLGLPYSAQALVLNFAWTPPTTGSPVVLYEFSADTDSTTVPTVVATSTLNSLQYNVSLGRWYFRVRGVDEFNRRGQYSWALALTDNGAPGRCGGLSYSKP